MSLASQLPDGTTFGRFRIGRLLGAGGMGHVYQATQLDDGREVALKVLAHEVEGAAFQARFAREGRLAASLSHPNVVYVFAADTIDGHPAIAMELVSGGTLEERVEREGALPVPEALRCIQQVIDGLEAAHARGILHRDVKPANCYVGADGVVKIGDFGLARPETADNLQLTQQGMFLGTPAFASPEQLLGDRVDVRSDIFAVGATLHFLLTGKPRYAVDSAARLIAMVMRGAVEDLAPLPSTVPAGLQSVVQRCLARDPAERFQDYDALREALRAFQPAAEAHAPLSRRMAAGVFDTVAVMLLDLPVGMVVNLALGIPATSEPMDPVVETWQMLAFALLIIAYFGIPEGRWGASAGKWLLRLRVEGGVAGQPPGLAAAALRAALLTIPVVAADGIGALIGATLDSGLRWVLPFAAKLGVLFLPRARRDNGWWGEHERLSHTRVVRVIGRQRREALAVATSFGPGALREAAGRVGPFDVLGRLPSPAPTPMLLGRDPALERDVWIQTHGPGVPAVEAEARLAMRPGQLRWIAGQREESGGWDAYAAVRGCSLSERLRHHVPWGELRSWLADIAEELVARNRAGTPSASLSTAHVWIRDDGHAMVLPFGLGAEAPAERATGGLVAASVDAILTAEAARGGALRWPARAHRMLEAMRTLTPPQVVALLAEDSGEPAVLTTQRRLVAWGIPVGFILVPSLSLSLAAWTDFATADADTRALLPYIEYVLDSRQDGVPDTRADSLVATYAGARIPAVRARFPNGAMRSMQEALLWNPLADSLITLAAQASATRRAEATQLVEQRWGGRPPKAVTPHRIVAGVATALVGVGAVFSCVGGLLLGRVPLLALLGLAVVDRTGRRVGRLRLLTRQVITWGPSALAALLFASGTGSSLPSWLGSVLAAVAAVTAGALLLLMRTPHRGIPDRLAGTIVVPE